MIMASKPKLLPLSGDTVELIENITYPITCVLISGSKPVVFEWFQNGNKLLEKSNLKIDNQAQVSILSLTNVRISDSGKYECRAKNPFGFDSIFTNILIKGLKINFFNYPFCSGVQNVALLRNDFS